MDDERPALQHLERMLKEDGRIQVEAMFTSPEAALAHLRQNKPDIVFLDIGMPGMSGLAAAEYVQAMYPDLPIVFITAYSEYAVEAFELQAMDYLLKPIVPARFRKMLDRVAASLARKAPMERLQPPAPHPNQPTVHCFKQFEIVDSAPSVSNLKWRTLKSKELFAFLLHQREEWVARDLLLETIWPHYDLERAIKHLHTSVYQIRKLLKEWQIGAVLEYNLESYRLLRGGIRTDAELFETAVRNDDADRGLRLYRGEYLAEHDFPWAVLRREELHRQYVRIMLQTAERQAAAGNPQAALQRLLALHEAEPYEEVICGRILKLYKDSNDIGALKRFYHTFAIRLQTELNTVPQADLATLYEELAGKP
ncbi:response regulator [Paenibacillus nanensis]|uniref:Response regulator n=2 Tax=Paenibacillus nanensis TaxID=393251 RepID=A0A3A1UQK1_9BACL|nr:response regulator [Paenibacillus nanensis]